MKAISPEWAAYAQLQEISARYSVIDDYSYGLEAGLNRLLELQSQPTCTSLASNPEDEARRAIASGRRASSRRRLAALELRSNDDAALNGEGVIASRQGLRRIFSLADGSDRLILFATGFGHEGAAIAAHLKLKPAALRKRLDRLRDRLAAA